MVIKRNVFIYGNNKTITDSTPIIRHLENEFSVRRVVPSDTKLSFLKQDCIINVVVPGSR